MIPERFWSLMRARGCDPSCGCGADFDIHPEALGEWIREHPDQVDLAAAQMDALL